MNYKKEIIKILEDEAVLLDEGYGTTGITEDEHEIIAERIVKLFAIPDVSQQRELFVALIDKMTEEDWQECYNGFAERVFDRISNK